MSSISTSNLSPQLFAANIVLLGLSFFAVAARLYARIVVTKRFSLADYLIFAAFIFSLLSSSLLIPAIASGLGRPIATLDIESIQAALKWLFATDIILITVLFLTKFSIVVLLLDISQRKIFSFLLFGVAGLLGVNWIFSNIVVFAQCKPLSENWNVNRGRKKEDCWSSDLRFASYLVESVIDVLTNFLLLLFTPTILLKVPLNIRERLGLLGITILGALAAIFSILLARSTTQQIYTTDPTHTRASTTIWVLLEVHLGILAASLPALHTLFPSLFSPSTASSGVRKHRVDISQISHPRPAVPPKEFPGMESYFKLQEQRNEMMKKARRDVGWPDLNSREGV